MAVQYRDYYEILGVEKSASQDEIKRSFKKLARKYHPDVAKEKAAAEEKFKEINEAYEVLSDPEKRQKYDTLGPGWEQSQGFPGADRGGGYEYHFGGSTGFSDFFESIFGARTGADPFGGFGRRQSRSSQPMAGQDIEADLLVRIEEIMEGATRELRLSRPSASGAPAKESTIRVKIPKGVSERQMIRCGGLGYPGVNGGPDGDLFLRVRLERHPDYRVSGHDLTNELVLAPWESVLGTSVTIPTPHGSVKLSIKPNTQPGTQMRLKGKGLPKGDADFGDLYVEIAVEFPESPTREEQELWKKLAETSQFSPRS
ncbi:MAG: J domain-containing protein [Verrucomicrobiota bacterium]